MDQRNGYEALVGKRLLVLGGTHASLDTVKTAISMGIHVTVTDDAPSDLSVRRAIDTVSVIDTDGNEMYRQRFDLGRVGF